MINVDDWAEICRCISSCDHSSLLDPAHGITVRFAWTERIVIADFEAVVEDRHLADYD